MTGKQSHNHPVTGAVTAAKILAAVKEQAVQDVFRPASANVQEVLLAELNSAPCDALPKPSYIARRANRLRQHHRPKDPGNLHFVLDETHLPANFLQVDVEARNP
ncbi:PREDICTED: uncharacterized protein LOC107351679 [Acropora digitifera]|uniref:uncharacterized protein LOC107351679 n=1 Tax=Acropora digitifera TaxID=70779 RepID=UPI00077A4FB9|nr:PREDICTED: uncharacterized protein LOC107351679 [Acropora digitifera]